MDEPLEHSYRARLSEFQREQGRLEDVYWSREGLLSVQIALAVTSFLAAITLGLRFLRRGEQVVLEAR